MRVGFLQFNPVFGRVRANVRYVLERLSSADADLIVLPELFNTGYQFVSRREADRLAEEIPEGYTVRQLAAFARRRRIHLVAGIAERRGRRLYNSAVLIGPEGVIERYRKAHLFYEERLWFSPGNTGFKVTAVGDIRVGLMVCFDWFFPEVARVLALKGADVICHPANLVLPYCPPAMVTRCIENRVFAVTANRVGAEERGGKERLTYIGQSQIVSPSGEILHRASPDQEELKVIEIDPRQARRKALNRYNHLFLDRRIGLYRDLGPSLRPSRRDAEQK